MCQLAAYVGQREKAPLLLRSLELQEPYFGGHATGLAVINKEEIYIEKGQGHVKHVKESTPKINELDGSVAIAHSRYNQTAKVDPRNNVKIMAHPFLNEDKTIALMHNGGINNYKELWDSLKKNHKFSSYVEKTKSITDSEVAVHMLSDMIKEERMDVNKAIKALAARLTGSFLLGIISTEKPDTVWIANWYQPCYIGIGDNETMFCSSALGFKEIEENMDLIFEPQKNSLITMTPEGADIEPLDVLRTVPEMNLDAGKLKKSILSILEDGELDFRALHHALNPDGWADAYELSIREWKKRRKNGVSIVNPYIDVLDELVDNNRINCRVDKRLEGGVRDTPRYSYFIP